LMNGRTTLMIAHRPSTLRNCNMILVLEDGRVTQMTSEVESIISGMQAVSVQS
jgi:ABC-type multidrug transport system fused ATPase/permease subunit